QKEKERIERGRPKNLQAYDEYLRGVYFGRAPDQDSMRKSIVHLEKALELEPDYPAALAFLGMQYGGLGFFGWEPLEQARTKSAELATRSLELDDAIPETHHSVATVAFYSDGDWARALREAERALELNPNYVDGLNDYAIFLTGLGRPDEAVAAIEKALELDPLSPNLHNIAAAVFAQAGRFSQALDSHNKAIEMAPIAGHTNLGVTYVMMGRLDDAIKEFERAKALGGTAFFGGNLGYAYALVGRREEALKILDEIKSQPNKGSVNYAMANVYAGLGDKDKALDYLERAYQEHTLFAFPLFIVEPFLVNLRDEPRFKELVRKVGLEGVHPPDLWRHQ
ncbi:MAG TPA: tetratricopeptide repeat protein, partial [Nitrososphaerales archaeon]|nr:tetratricopeptide repeat protein [Nitrososphaerales archaeon]